MSFNVFQDDPSPARGPGASAAIAQAQRRRARQRGVAGAAASLALVLVAVVALRSPNEGRPVVANEPSNQQPMATTAIGGPTTSTPIESTTTSTLRRSATNPHVTTTSAPPPTTTTSWYGQTWVSHPGTANLTFSGVRSGPLASAVASCTPRPGASSDLQVNGTLNGTPWVLYVQSYTGEMGGAYQVITGEAGGGTGMSSQGYYVRETYPKTLSGVTNVDWAHGASLDVELTSEDGQTPVGNVHVSGSVTCS